MRIRTRIQLIIVLSVVMAATVGLLLFLSIHAMNEASRKAGIAAEVVKGVVELKILTSGYLLHPGDRSLIQWRSRYDFVTKCLTGGYFRSPDEKIPVDEILKNLERIKTVFTKITIDMRKKQQLGKQESSISRALQVRLEAELLVKAQAAVSLVFPLQQKIQAELVTTQKRATLLTVLLLLTLTVVIVAISLWINRSIARPIAKLEEDIQIIGSGNLDYKVGTTSKDEIGYLSRAFDKMTGDLKETTVSIVELNKEIDERKQAEEALRESEEKYRSLVESTEDSIYLLDRNCAYLFMNKKYLSRLGLEAEKAKGRTYARFHSEDDTKDFIGKAEKVFETGKSLYYEYRSQRDGRYYLRTLSPVKETDGSSKAIIVVSKDITELKRTEKALQTEKDNLRNIFEAMEDGIYIVNQGYDIQYVNPALIKDFGPYEGVKCYQYFHDRDEVCPWCKNQDVWAGKTVRWEWYSFKNERTYDLIDTPLTLPNGSIGKLEIFRDITDMKRVEKALEREKERAEEYLNIAGVMLAVVDAEENITLINKKGCEILGYNEGELTGRNWFDTLVPERMRGEVRDIFSKLLAEDVDPVEYYQNPLLTKGGDERLFSFHNTVIRASDGKIVATLSSAEDITERKQAEEELKRSREELRNLAAYLQSAREQERTSIAREIHDELAQALTALKMDISWLGKKLPKDQKTLLEKTRTMTKLTDTTIKTVKKISTELRPGLLDDLGLVAALEWQAGEFQDRTGITCELTVDPEDFIVDPDRSTAIFRIFQETLTNIARHAKAKRVTASLKEKDGTLELKVKDNGKGITKEQISDPKSFGLIGMRERVHTWGGEVKIKGVPGEGTTVTVRIPIEEISRKGAKDAK